MFSGFRGKPFHKQDKKGAPRWDGHAMQSAGLFYICLTPSIA